MKPRDMRRRVTKSYEFFAQRHSRHFLERGEVTLSESGATRAQVRRVPVSKLRDQFRSPRRTENS